MKHGDVVHHKNLLGSPTELANDALAKRSLLIAIIIKRRLDGVSAKTCEPFLAMADVNLGGH